MKKAKKSKLHMVKTDWDEIEQKVHEHRMKRLKITAIIVGACAAAWIVYYILVQHKSYTSYEVVGQVERTDTEATSFLEFGGNILKYSNDGASCTNVENQLIWNQTFEMQSPVVSVCEPYVAFADRGGKEIYVMDTTGTQGKIEVNMPISKIETSSRGTVAVLMEDDGISYLSLYNRNGEQLAEGAIHAEAGGVPLDLAISPNGENLAVSVLGINSGKTDTTISFYNFGSAGQNEVDHIVGSFSYADTVIPKVTYVSDSRLLAFADHAVYAYSGGGAPEEAAHLDVPGETASVFYDESYFGLVSSDGEDEGSRNIKIYNTNCKETETIHTTMPFSRIRFLDNHEIFLSSDNQCAIYTLGGARKFQYEFDVRLYDILFSGGFRNYVFVLEGKTEQVRLKLFDIAEEKK